MIVPTVVEYNPEIRNLSATFQKVKLDISNINSQLIDSEVCAVNNGMVSFDLSYKAQGIYYVRGNVGEPSILNFIKKIHRFFV